MSTASTMTATEVHAELMDRHLRKMVRRRQLLAILASVALVLGYLGGKVGSHLIAARWLEANQYKVGWSADQADWKRGGTTTVKFGRGHGFSFLFGGNARDSADLKFLTWLNRVEELDLSLSTNLQDRDLENLDRLTDLRILDLDRSRSSAWPMNDAGRLTDATLARIKPLKRLERLNLGGQRITDAGLANLAGLGGLKALDLRRSAITDAGLGHLVGLPSLKSLDLTGTKVTPEGVRGFEASRPGVVVLADPTPTDRRSIDGPDRIAGNR